MSDSIHGEVRRSLYLSMHDFQNSFDWLVDLFHSFSRGFLSVCKHMVLMSLISFLLMW